jgi:hypothetical protein
VDKFSKELFLRELEEAGVSVVRVRLQTNFYGSLSPKRKVAEEWLWRREGALLAQTGRKADAALILAGVSVLAAIAAVIIAYVRP